MVQLAELLPPIDPQERAGASGVGQVLDELICEAITTRLGDFTAFEQDVLQALARS